jgi:DNA-binding CsgD family transcriptional regulator
VAAAEREDLQLWNALRQALDQSVCGVAVLNANRRIAYLNRTAKVILDRDQALEIRHGVLNARFPEVASALAQTIRQACMREVSVTNGLFTVTRTNSDRPLILRVRSLRDGSGNQADSNLCLVFIVDPDLRIQPDAQILNKTFQLTPTEVEIAVRLAQGHDIEAICNQLSFGVNTARTHLKRVFDKTRTRRQAELVRLILMSSLSEEIVGYPPFG